MLKNFTKAIFNMVSSLPLNRDVLMYVMEKIYCESIFGYIAQHY